MRAVVIAAVAVLAAAASAVADPPRAISVDYTYPTAPALQVYRANARTFTVTVKNSGTVVDLTGYTPSMWWATSNTASSYVTGTCAVVTATAGTFRCSFSSAALNYAPGTYVYGIGLTSGTYTTARMGTLVITGDPAASGATPLATSSTNVTIGAYSWTGAFPTSAIPALPQYLTAEADTLQTVITRGAAATNATPIGLYSGGAYTGSVVVGNSVYIDGASVYITSADESYWTGAGFLKIALTDTLRVYAPGEHHYADSTWYSNVVFSGAAYTALSNIVQAIIDAQP